MTLYYAPNSLSFPHFVVGIFHFKAEHNVYQQNLFALFLLLLVLFETLCSLIFISVDKHGKFSEITKKKFLDKTQYKLRYI